MEANGQRTERGKTMNDELTEAQTRAMEHHLRISEQIERLERINDDLIDDAAGDPKNWAITGSLANLVSQLDDILEGYPED